MLVTGPGGVQVDARYPAGCSGRALLRRRLDLALVECAAAAGAQVELGLLVCRPLVAESGRVCGVAVRGTNARDCELRAGIVIAADGRESRLARALSLARHPRWPRRWAVGAYFGGVSGMSDRGEMHVRRGHYIGLAPLPGGITNVCVVTADRRRLADTSRLIAASIQADRELRARFEHARPVANSVTLGPLAVEARGCGVHGLLLAGDSAGFVDPMTGDGLRFALRGGELAAIAALAALADGRRDAHRLLSISRRREFRHKWRFNRALRRLAASPRGVSAASRAARFFPAPVQRMVAYAGDLSAA
jgi:flavin-dependent dehydrogenase